MSKTDDATQQLNRLALIHFRSHDSSEFQFCPKINCLVGLNGAGKTNVLDAIYYLSMTKSCFNTADSQNIRYDNDFFVVQGEYLRKGTPESIYCGVKRGQKKVFRRNMNDYERMSEHIGLLPVVMVSPADSNLILGGSDERRRFMNEVISQYDRTYLDNMMHYNRALEQRNALLKSFADNRTFDRDILEVWNEQLIRTGNLIFQSRTGFCEALIPVFQEYYRQIADSDEQVKLAYRSQLQENEFATLLENAEEKDRVMQFTTCGVHKDDLLLLMNNIPIKKAGSQGQQKTFLVALKLANSDFIRLHCNITPLLLLDDIFDKFDAQRVSHIVRLVSGDNFGQIFITDTGREHIENILKQSNCTHQLFEINSEMDTSC
ncbi:MAG: DNA replication and repair protein RecF [Bacteroidales bacterium]|jgi:DNA replication and repair protein RecF|nr:DNA replication and repair protein RecF [Bacteroidales bacterium]